MLWGGPSSPGPLVSLFCSQLIKNEKPRVPVSKTTKIMIPFRSIIFLLKKPPSYFPLSLRESHGRLYCWALGIRRKFILFTVSVPGLKRTFFGRCGKDGCRLTGKILIFCYPYKMDFL